ncbi:MAG: hypothetical protein WC296_05995 [Candidatus Izemoplasmatales bacterium]|jgi:hypothetical protein
MMMNVEPATKQTNVPTIKLIDETLITQDEAIKTGEQHRVVFFRLAVFLIILAILVMIQLISDLLENATGWVMALIIEAVFLGFAGLFLIIYYRLDLTKYGVSMLNYQIKTRNRNAINNPTYNEIKADLIIDLDVKNGNMVFVNSTSKQWQYRLKTKLSRIYESVELADIAIIRDGLAVNPDAIDSNQLAQGPYGIRIRYTNIDNDYTEINCKTIESAVQCLDGMIQIKVKH